MLEACSVVSPVSASMIMYRVVAVFWVGCQKFSVRQMWGRGLRTSDETDKKEDTEL